MLMKVILMYDRSLVSLNPFLSGVFLLLKNKAVEIHFHHPVQQRNEN